MRKSEHGSSFGGFERNLTLALVPDFVPRKTISKIKTDQSGRSRDVTPKGNKNVPSTVFEDEAEHQKVNSSDEEDDWQEFDVMEVEMA